MIFQHIASAKEQAATENSLRGEFEEANCQLQEEKQQHFATNADLQTNIKDKNALINILNVKLQLLQ